MGATTPIASRSRAAVSGAVVACFVLALGGIGAARVPTGEQEALCIPIPLITTCSTPTPTPTPTPSPSGGGSGSSSGSGTLGGLGGLLGGGGSDGTGGADNSAPGGIPVIPLVSTPDPGAPTMTLPAAQLGGSSISFTGLKGVSLVTVGLANGEKTTVIRLAADSITIDDFSLDVRPTATQPGLVSTATQMKLNGNVVVYVNSVSAALLGGGTLTLGASTPIPSNEKVPSSLASVHLGLVGVTANSIYFESSHQFFE